MMFPRANKKMFWPSLITIFCFEVLCLPSYLSLSPVVSWFLCIHFIIPNPTFATQAYLCHSYALNENLPAMEVSQIMAKTCRPYVAPTPGPVLLAPKLFPRTSHRISKSGMQFVYSKLSFTVSTTGDIL